MALYVVSKGKTIEATKSCRFNYWYRFFLKATNGEI